MKDHLRQLISRGKTQQAIQELLQITQQSGDSELHNEVILQSSRFEAYKKANLRGISTFEENGVSMAQVHHALLNIIDQVPDNQLVVETAPNQSADSPSKIGIWKKWRSWITGLGLLIAIPAGIAELSGYSLRDLWGGSHAEAFSVTVLVHGKKGKDDRILQNQGEVILDIGTTREVEKIDDQGEATFKGLSQSFRGKKALISIAHDQPYFPTKRNQEYELTEGQAIYLEVQLEGLHKIQGRILDFDTERPLDSVRVSVQNTATYTDPYGWYELTIPPDSRAKFIKVTLYKEGYQMVQLDSIAPHIGQETGYSLQKEKQ